MKFISKKLLIAAFMMIFTSAIFAGSGNAGWVAFSQVERQQSPQFQVDSNWKAIDIQFAISGFEALVEKTKEGEFTRLSVEKDSYQGEVGYPRIPAIRRFVEIPYGAEVDLQYQIVQSGEMELSEAGLSFPLIPVQAPVPKLPGALESAPFVINEAVYQHNEFLGGPAVRIRDIDYMRGHRIAVIEITPLGYNPVKNAIQYASEMQIQLNFSNSDEYLTLENARRYYNPAFDQILENLSLNHGAYRDFVFPPPVPISYLIICHDNYVNALAPFVALKESAGYDVTVTPTSEAGSTTTAIRNYIANAYQNWLNPPVYVLLAGDTDTIPCYTGEASGTADDNQYTELEGTGFWTPDIMIGRFSIRSTTDLENILAKVVPFEQMTLPSTDYFKDSVWLASSDHASMLEATHEWCFNNHILPYDPANNTFHSVYERLGGDTQDFADNVNAGRGIVCYSGHGYGDGSGTASIHFVHSNVQALTNADLYGNVMVFACGTNLHDQTISFGERWLLEANKGSVSYWGTSDSSYWDEDDAEQREIYRAQHADSIHTLSAMYFYGLIGVYNSGSSSANYYFDIYNLMGDPSMDFVGRIPETPVIDCPDSTTPNEQDFDITVNVGGSGRQGALVAVTMDDTLLGAAYTNASGVATVHFTPPGPGNANITVTGHNLVWTEKPLLVVAAGCGVVSLNREMYNCDQEIVIRLWDSDLNINPGALDTAEVGMYSDSEPTPETVTLTEVSPDSGEFSGTIQTSATQSGPGFLLVSHGDEITAHYADADCEGSPQDVYDTATTDCEGPIISGLTVSDITTSSATISWHTSEESNTVVTWGETTPPGDVVTDERMVLEHEVTLTGLETCTDYFFKVSSTDAGGNIAEDDNGGSYYQFTTLQLILFLSENMDTNPGWTYEGQWAWGQPLGNSGDPSSGYTGENVVGYNLAGDYGDGLPPTYVTTNAFDCSGATEVFLSYWKWLGVESASYDHAGVEVSGDNGTTWNTIWTHTGGSFEDTDWSYVEYDISDWAAGNSNVKLRWVMGPTDGSMTYCGWNIDDVEVSYTAPCNVPILVYGDHVIDDSAGNNNGEINAGETISMSVTLENNGLSATGVSAVLTTSNPHVNITTDAANFPDIPQSGTGTSLTNFVFTVDTGVDDGEVIPFTIAYTTNETSGSTGFSDTIVAPSLAYGNVVVADPERGDADGILDPGETAQLIVTLDNLGNGMASSVSAVLTSNHPEYITINDDTATFPDIMGGSSGTCQEPYFMVTASPSTPEHQMIQFTLDISAEGYTASDSFDLEVTTSTFARRYFWSMDYCPSWYAEGAWEHGVPQGNEGDPTSGYTGDNVFGYNLSGDYTNNLPETYLTTADINCSNLINVEVRYMRWLGVESASYDHAAFEVSNNGTTWNTVWEHTGSSFTDTSWIPQSFDISAYADEQATVYLRWVMGPTDYSVTYCGWNIDDVEIWAESSGVIPPTNTPTVTPVPPTRTPTPSPIPPTFTPTFTPVPPTDTPVPTETPIPPTDTPIPTETPIPPTNTPRPTHTPVEPTPTTAPNTPTPTEGPTTIVMDLEISDTSFQAGDHFLLTRRAINPGPEVTLEEWIILDVYGMYWFYPRWMMTPDYVLTTLPGYSDETMTIMDFNWPEGNFGTVSGLYFWGAFLDPNTSQIVGSYDFVEFGYE
ncbi:hypothetical protein JW979_04930 [bacterium]|nr:hypothetical protein [candidate division CSSED10-310 bacterium]